MNFTVLRVGSSPASGSPEGFYLTKDGWNDWFRFKTQFFLRYLDTLGRVYEIGFVKVGQRGLREGSPELPDAFDGLSPDFFSVGQGESYYLALQATGRSAEALEALRDMAYDRRIFRQYWQQDVSLNSLLRSVSPRQVQNAFHRIATGSVRPTIFDFRFRPPGQDLVRWEDGPETKLSFTVRPRSLPPSNVHVLIGRNGVGKTRMLRSMIASAVLFEPDSWTHGDFEMGQSTKAPFSGLISVSFSAFDRKLFDADDQLRTDIFYEQVSLRSDEGSLMDEDELSLSFADSAVECTNPALADRWKRALRMLEADPVFKYYEFSRLADWWREAEEIGTSQEEAEAAFRTDARELFTDLSSGHKVVLFAITKLVQLLEERTLVVMDEPEAHLHPPLLGAFVRAVSTLLMLRNGVAVAATHSPVVLQEVPVSCVWRLRRSGDRFGAERLRIETFAENVDTLTREIFGLEVTKSGYHALLQAAVDEGFSYDEIVDEEFDDQIGSEGRALLRSMLASRRYGEES